MLLELQLFGCISFSVDLERLHTVELQFLGKHLQAQSPTYAAMASDGLLTGSYRSILTL
jgi:hypothetical protein